MSRKGSRRARQGRPHRRAIGVWIAGNGKRGYYHSRAEIERDFPSSSPEYRAAALFFQSEPMPSRVGLGVPLIKCHPPGDPVDLRAITITAAPHPLGQLEVFDGMHWREYDATGETVEQSAEGISALVNAEAAPVT